jgi:protein-tyrosine kinase
LEVSADAAILSEVVDYIVVVVPYGKVTESRINKAVKLLPQEKIAGIIINNRKNYVQ